MPQKQQAQTAAVVGDGGIAAELACRQRQAELDNMLPERFGDQVPYTPATLLAVEGEIRTFTRMTAVLAYEIGRRLLWVKGHEQEMGRPFMAWLEAADLGVSRKSAYRYMALASRFQRSPKLLSALEGRGVNQAYAIMDVYDDDDLDALETEGVLGDMTADEIARMSRRELQEHARDLRQQIAEGTEDLLAEKRRVAELEVQLKQRPKQLDLQFIGYAQRTIKELEQFLERFGEADSEEELLAAVGGTDREIAYDIMRKIETLAAQAIHLARILQPIAGSRVEVGPDGRAVTVSNTAAAPVQRGGKPPVAGRRS